ncbi:hypothetical protein CSE45_4243 [Citreicella sp. SE45]|nr:hypothetical protein CSE45_4243 [Citreicella sp. SE45]
MPLPHCAGADQCPRRLRFWRATRVRAFGIQDIRPLPARYLGAADAADVAPGGRDHRIHLGAEVAVGADEDGHELPEIDVAGGVEGAGGGAPSRNAGARRDRSLRRCCNLCTALGSRADFGRNCWSGKVSGRSRAAVQPLRALRIRV